MSRQLTQIILKKIELLYNNGCKGQAGTAVFRSSITQISFLGLSNLVAFIFTEAIT